MHANNKHLDAFITPWGLYEWLSILMGLSNAPGGFQRYMESILRDIRNGICILDIDDLIVFSRNFSDYVEAMWKVLQKFQKHEIKLSKCKLLQKEVSFLGRTVLAECYTIDPKCPAAVEAMKDSNPRTIKDITTLLDILARSVERFLTHC